jgi:hypothetical protein
VAWNIQSFAVVNPATNQVLAAYTCTNPADVALNVASYGPGCIAVPLPPGHPLLAGGPDGNVADWTYNGTAIVKVTS